MNDTVNFWQALQVVLGAMTILAIVVWIIGVLEKRFGEIVLLCAAIIWLISCSVLVAWAISSVKP
jgi:hypothetical protein